MAIAPAQFYAAPFDAIAERYDDTFTRSKIGQAQRASVWKKLETAFRPGDCVLDTMERELLYAGATWR